MECIACMKWLRMTGKEATGAAPKFRRRSCEDGARSFTLEFSHLQSETPTSLFRAYEDERRGVHGECWIKLDHSAI